MRYGASDDKMCEVHKGTKRNPKVSCPACLRASIDSHRMRVLKRLFPRIFSEGG